MKLSPRLLVLVLVLSALFCLTPAVLPGLLRADGAGAAPAPSAREIPPAPVRRETSSRAPSPAPEPEPERATLLAAGDNLIHDALYLQAAARGGEGGYDFSPLYARVAGRIAAADLAFINQETVMDPERPPATYPCFNSPPVLAAQLAQTGFDVANLANNHMLDMGTAGLLRSIGVVDAVPGLARVGAWKDDAEKDRITVLERGGIRFAFVGFADYTNAGGSSQGRDLCVFTDDAPMIERQMALARGGADVVVASVHFGVENTTEPAAAQRATAQRLCDLGADVVLGHHPHVIQPVEELVSPGGRRTLVFYSLGNFVSAQTRPQNLVGLMPEITFERDKKTDAVSVASVVVRPVVTHYGTSFRDLQIYPLEEYTQALAASHGAAAYGEFSLPMIRELLRGVIGEKWTVPGR